MLNKLFKSKATRQKIFYLLSMLCGLSGIVFLVLSSFNKAIVFYYTPSEITPSIQEKKRLRVGGKVKKDSLKTPSPLTYEFILEDEKASVTVKYEGITPDLFKEDHYAIAEGYYNLNHHVFYADTVLAKHDETYKPQNLKKP